MSVVMAGCFFGRAGAGDAMLIAGCSQLLRRPRLCPRVCVGVWVWLGAFCPPFRFRVCFRHCLLAGPGWVVELTAPLGDSRFAHWRHHSPTSGIACDGRLGTRGPVTGEGRTKGTSS